MSTADSLIERGACVTIFERHQEAGHGASRFNSGMIHPSQATPWVLDKPDKRLSRQLVSWANQSRDLLMKRRQQLGCKDFHRPSTTLKLFDDESTGLAEKTYHDEIGVRTEIYQGLWGFGRFALKFPDDESGSAYHYCQTLIASLLKRGCSFAIGEFVSIYEQSNGLYIKSNSGSQKFDRIVVAAGSDSARVLKPLGLDFPVVPVKGHALVFDRPNCELPEIPIMHGPSHSALTAFDDHVRLSGTINEESPYALQKIWGGIAPDLTDALGPPMTTWSADRPMSKIGCPIIGETSIDGVWVNSGHGHMGWSLCSWSGEALARFMLDNDMVDADQLILP